MKKSLFLFAALLVTITATADDLVQDHAHLLSAPARERLETKLRNYAAKTGIEFAVVSVPSLRGQEISLFGDSVKNALGVGNKESKMGLLYLIAPTEHGQSLRVGRGLEPYLTDIESVRILRNTRPKLSESIEDGILARVDATIALLQPKQAEATAEHVEAVTHGETRNSSDTSDVIWYILGGIVVAVLAGWLINRHRALREAQARVVSATITTLNLLEAEIFAIASSITNTAEAMKVNAESFTQEIHRAARYLSELTIQVKQSKGKNVQSIVNRGNEQLELAQHLRTQFEERFAFDYQQFTNAQQLQEYLGKNTILSRLRQLSDKSAQALEAHQRLEKLRVRKLSTLDTAGLFNPLGFKETDADVLRSLKDVTKTHAAKMSYLRMVSYALDTLYTPVNAVIALEKEYGSAALVVTRELPSTISSMRSEAGTMLDKLDRLSDHPNAGSELRLELAVLNKHETELSHNLNPDYLDVHRKLTDTLREVRSKINAGQKILDDIENKRRRIAAAAAAVIATALQAEEDDRRRRNSYSSSSYGSSSRSDSPSSFSYGGDSDSGGGGSSTSSNDW